jgi:UDP-N-acetylmuramoyl-L-alanyl-D-glutamate--2,6-diaminopimelate ligase
MKLRTLLAALSGHEFTGNPEVEIRSIELDSRRVAGGELFVCLEGLARDGHDFAGTAVSRGAAALLVTRPLPELASTPQIVVGDAREATARLAAVLYGHPSRELEAVGVTGTNGKTTVTHLVTAMAGAAGERAELLGTLGSGTAGSYVPTGFTTPEAPVLQRLFREAVGRGTRWMAVEVSSHALAQKRTYATDWSAVVFTNLSRDHLDYHGDMVSYRRAKEALFRAEERGSSRSAVAVINAEDGIGRELAAAATPPVVTYGFRGGVDYRARRVRTGPRGTTYELVTPQGTVPVRLPLLGRFNVQNALAAQAVGLERGIPLAAVVRGVEGAARVRGRLEPVPADAPFLVLVDYAHTPDALSHALLATRSLTRGRLWVVFGCGGERDRGKRPQMGRVAATLADEVVVTSDNPRSEDPGEIVREILAGTSAGPARVRSEVDRARAIALALRGARGGDTVVVAGKGHETTQILGKREIPFDDREIARDLLREMGFHVDDERNHV